MIGFINHIRISVERRHQDQQEDDSGLGYSCFSCHLDLVFSVVYSILSPIVCPMVNDMKLGQCVLPERKDMCACLQVVNMYPQSTYCYFIGSQSFQIKVSQQVKHKRTVRDRSL